MTYLKYIIEYLRCCIALRLASEQIITILQGKPSMHHHGRTIRASMLQLKLAMPGTWHPHYIRPKKQPGAPS